MSIEKVRRGGNTSYRVRWREGGRNRARTFNLRGDAERWDTEVRRRRQLGTLHLLDAGTETLDEYTAGPWAQAHVAHLAPKTRQHYAQLYDTHVAPFLGSAPLRTITPERIARWQTERLAAGAGPIAIRQAFDLLGTILQRAYESERIRSNPARLVRKAPRPRREETRPLSPATVEKMRAYLLAGGSTHPQRDATLISVLAYSGLRPGEALALRWGDVRENTLLIQRALSLGDESDTKTRAHRTVRLLAPLAQDLREWRMAAGRPTDRTLIFPADDGGPWSTPAYQSWRRRAFRRAWVAAELEHARPYDLRHSFASLLLHEGRHVIYVARQLGHDARLTLTRYGHVLDELDGAGHVDPDAEIRAARAAAVPTEYPQAAVGAV